MSFNGTSTCFLNINIYEYFHISGKLMLQWQVGHLAIGDLTEISYKSA